MNNTVPTPSGWLVLGLPWPANASGGFGESAAAIAPQMIPRHLVDQSAKDVLDLAAALAADPSDGPGKTVFFSDITRWLDSQGKTWGDLGIDYEAVIDGLLNAPVPILYLTLSAEAHAVVCDASRQAGHLYYADGRTETVTSEKRRDVHDFLTATLERDWPPYIKQLIDSGAVQVL